MDILQLYRDFSVDHVTEGDHRHGRPGWVNVECPFCVGNPGYHLGYNMDDDYFHCWRCGGHSIISSLKEILKKPTREVRTLVKQYDALLPSIKPVVKINRKPFKPPSDLIPLREDHERYLEKRGYDPEYLKRVWRIQSTGVLSSLDNISYKNRIYIPIHWQSRLESFTTRSTKTKKDAPKYMSCPDVREGIPHKHILYGDPTGWTDVGVVVEGPTDVWRMGERACGVFGIEYKPQQIRLLAQLFQRVFIVFDPDPQARLQADKLVAELKFRGVEALRVDISTDPGDMTQDDANHLIRQLI